VSMRCTRCAIDFPEDKQLCTVCGDSLAPSDVTTPFPRCSNCGAAVALNDRFCPGCGAGRGDASTEAPPTARRPPVLELCPACEAHVSPTDRICDLCGADLTQRPWTGPPPVSGPLAAPSGDSAEELLAFRHFDAKHRRELRRSITRGVATGLLLTLLLVVGVNAYRSRSASDLGIPVPSATLRLPRGKEASQVATADEVGIKISGVGAADPERSEAAIRRTVEQHLGELQEEYVTALQTAPAAEGVVTFHMTLAADGTVAYVRSTALGLADRGMLANIERQAAGWRFAPSPAGLTSVHYPLVFHLPKSDPRQLVARLQGSSGPAADSD
jgi:RNA polymerase subunit RPABC4/transcription elongation factor Spt4